MDEFYNENGLTHRQNAERLEELFSTALQAFYDIEDCVGSPSEIKQVIKSVQKEFSRINDEFLAPIRGKNATNT